uniref:1,4-alpha-D-glucan glucanohydrolase n=1 Tax=Manihot esculenta TaxID=3983 RepID=A0A2C9WDG2_MANES
MSGILPCCHLVPSASFDKNVSIFCLRKNPLIFPSACRRKRRFSYNSNWQFKPRTTFLSSTDDYNDTFTSGVNSGDGLSSKGDEENEVMAAKKALSEARAKQEAMEKERNELLEKLARYEVKQQENEATILHDKELAIAELEATKSHFHQKLQETVEENFTLESKLVLAKQDAVELAVQVEKLAEIAIKQATSRILEDAQMRVLAAETSAADAALQIEEQIRNATEGTIMSVVEQSKDAIQRALGMAENAGDYATKAVAIFSDGFSPVDEIASIKSENISLKGIVNDLESQLLIMRSEVDKFKVELEHVHAKANASELRAHDAEKALLEFQESNKKTIFQREEDISSFLEKIKKDAAEKKKAASKAFKVELESIKAAIEAAKETAHSRENVYMRRCESLQRSIRASEEALKTWRHRAEMAESLFLQDDKDEDAIFVVNGGRIDLLTDDDSLKWKLLSDGPRRELPQRMARRIRTIRPKFPPRKIDVSEALTSKLKHLDLPKLDEVWSIAQEKPKEGDTLIEHVIEKETIEKKRKALEQALKQKTIQWQRTPEHTKLEPGTGTGREIVFQAFNWESWRREWYVELAPKAADLSQCGVTSVWLPPPTESVAPQGYMPSDLYNLNSAYGSVEELKHCIEEMHAHNILALGDVVLNHRCAHKQSPNGVWNIFGGKLAWGPEAIVCDDPTFQGRGNPSSGM